MDTLDMLDIDILRLLQADAEHTHKEIAYALNRSVGTIHERIRRLKSNGYIRRMVAILDPKKINKGLIAYSHVLLHDHAAETLRHFEQEIVKLPEVMECFQMSGTFDFLLRIVTNDMDGYRIFYREKLAVLPGISTVQSYFVLMEIKAETAYNL